MKADERIQDIYLLSPMQEGILAHCIFNSNKVDYIEQFSYTIIGNFDVNRYKVSITTVVKKYDMLRTRFVYKNISRPVQVVLNENMVKIRYCDASDKTLKQSDTFVEKIRKKELSEGFNISKECPLKITIVKVKKNKYRIIWTFHHLIMDAWSLKIVLSDLHNVYKCKGVKYSEEILKYSKYIKWIRKQNQETAKKWWKEYLCDYKSSPFLLDRYKNKGEMKLNKSEIKVCLSEGKCTFLNELAMTVKNTLFTIIESLFALAIGSLFSAEEVLLGIVKNGRDCELLGTDKAVGCFIKTVVTRINVASHQNFVEFVKKVSDENMKVTEYDYLPIYKIPVEETVRKEILHHMPIIVYDNESVENVIKNEVNRCIEEFSATDVHCYEQINYELYIKIYRDKKDRIVFNIKYDESNYDKETCYSLLDKVNYYIEKLQANYECSINDLLYGTIERIEAKDTGSKIAILSTFTVTPIQKSFDFWVEQFKVSVALEYFSYSSVFETLANIDSVINKGCSFIVILVRFEDWIEEVSYADEEICNKLEILFSDYVGMLEQAFLRLPGVIGILPVAQSVYSNTVCTYIRDMYKRVENMAEKWENVNIIDFEKHVENYLLKAIYVDNYEKRGYIAYSDSFNALIGTLIARNAFAWKKKRHKVIVVDCDNTLWEGVCGEGKVKVNAKYKYIQKLLLDKKKQGFLLAICSKNNSENVWRVFDENEDMILNRDDFVICKINWARKSDNIREMASEMNLGIDSFLFFDDDYYECLEVMQNCPEVLTFIIPNNEENIHKYFYHIWPLDVFQITDEDQRKSELYLQQWRRENAVQLENRYDDYLKKLNMKIYFNTMHEEQCDRVVQLINKTNQFNNSCIRRDKQQLLKLLSGSNVRCWFVEVEDCFGNYGIIGTVICMQKENVLFVDTFLISCRALGRHIEDYMLVALKKYCLENNLSYIEAIYKSSPRNEQVYSFFVISGWQEIERSGDEVKFRISVCNIKEDCSFAVLFLEKKVSNEKSNKVNGNNKPSVAYTNERDNYFVDYYEDLSMERIDNNREYYLPFKYANIERLIVKNNDVRQSYPLLNENIEYASDIIDILYNLIDNENDILSNIDCYSSLSENLPFDSLVAMQLIIQLEAKYNFEVDDEDLLIDNMDSIKAISELIKKTLAKT